MLFSIPRALSLCLLFSVSVSLSQTGTIHGTVSDEKTGEEIVGVNVLFTGTTMGAASDLDGKFQVRNIPPGRYAVRFSYVGYAAKTVEGVEIKANETLKMDISLAQETFEQEEVTVTAERVLSTEAAVIAQRKRAAGVTDAVSIEQVRKTPDATSGDVLKRVTGITVTDNKFVFVRGVPDRYNGTTLNGVSVTATDNATDKKSFTFDVIPSSLIENTVIAKTSTPDLPGDFTGGLVQLNTLDFPSREVLKVGFSSGYNSMASLRSIRVSEGGGRDWLGIDDGTRDFPKDNDYTVYSLASRLPNNWAQRTKKAPLNGGANITYGDQFALGEERSLGVIGSLSYKNSYSRTADSISFVDPGGEQINVSAVRDQYSVLWGGIGNIGFKLSGLHKFKVNASVTQTADDKAGFREGLDINVSSFPYRTESTEWDQRTLFNILVGGEHMFPSFGATLVEWKGAYASTIAGEPDNKYVPFVKLPDGDQPTSGARRSWSELREFTRSVGIDVTTPVDAGKIKIGAFAEGKGRTYSQQFFQIDPDRTTQLDPRYYTMSLDSIFRPENFGRNGWYMYATDVDYDVYFASHTLLAAYGMVDVPFEVLGQHLRFVGGVRMENYESRVTSNDPALTTGLLKKTVVVKAIDYLPSMNLTYSVTDALNLRLAYNQSVNRPEFRELANFYYFDYNEFVGKWGNPNLRRALSRNYDARIEFFPGPGEVFAVSYFRKIITGSIERYIQVAASLEFRVGNGRRGVNEGWEFEIQKDLGFVSSYLKNFRITANYTTVTSEVEAPVSFYDTTLVTREFEGQAPYSANVGVSFTEPALGTNVTVLFNEFGRRLYSVAQKPELDLFEVPRAVIDLSVTQPIGSMFELKFAISDLNGKEEVLEHRTRTPYSVIFKGTTYSLQGSLNF